MSLNFKKWKKTFLALMMGGFGEADWVESWMAMVDDEVGLAPKSLMVKGNWICVLEIRLYMSKYLQKEDWEGWNRS